MVLFPNCKINLGLNIIRKRADGYHDLETVFYPLDLHDAIEVVADDDISLRHESRIEFTFSGISLSGKTEENLCVKAYQLLRNNHPGIPPIKMHLHKTIPPGAGLGGGSADAAFTLRLLNQKFNLKLTTETLLDYALRLGSDCPFFIIDKTCFATGRGEFLQTVKVDLSGYKIVIVTPAIHISTAEAFSLLTPVLPSKSIKEIIEQPIKTWKEELTNDFEEPLFDKYPEIKTIKDQLYQSGALYASMSGSGSTVYGIFEKNRDIELSFPSNYFLKQLTSKGQ